MAHRIVTLPGDGIGPEIMAPALELLRRRRRLRVRGAPVRRRLDRRARHGADRRGARRLQRRRRRAARRRRRPEVGHDRPRRKPRPEQGLLGLRKGLGPVRQPAPGQAAAGALRRLAAAARADRGHRPARRARAHRRHLLRREDAHGRHAPRDLCAYTVEEIERIARVGVPRRARRASRASTRPTCSRPSRLWREVVMRACTRSEFPNIELEHVLVDNAAMQLVSLAAPLRRDPHREHVRRHPHRRGGDAHRLDRDAARARRSARPAAPGAVRAGARLGAGHRRAGHRQPAGDVPVGGDDAAPRARLGKRGGGCRIGGGQGALDEGLRTPDLGGTASTAEATQAVLANLEQEAMNVEPTDLIWMNGEFVAWEDAKVHVLTHGLHYGTGVFEGVRCYDTELGPAVFRNAEHIERLLQLGRALLHADPVRRASSCARRRSSWSPQRPALLLHPPDRLPRLRHDGPEPARRAGRRDDRLLGVGRLPRRGGQAQRRPREGLLAGGASAPTR